MSHAFLEGKVYHKRYTPVSHDFTYPFYLLDIDVNSLKTLKNRLFSFEKFNLFSFYTKDHFGDRKNFRDNIENLLKKHGVSPTKNMRFITLPRVLNYVFNPISLLIMIEDGKPLSMLVEVHNYNGGRIVYPVTLHEKSAGTYVAVSTKEMYVSPFFDTTGEYHFTLRYHEDKMSISVALFKKQKKQLIATFTGYSTPFSTSSTWSMFKKHTFITLWVVTRTLKQSFLLWRKKLTWYSPRTIDQQKRD